LSWVAASLIISVTSTTSGNNAPANDATEDLLTGRIVEWFDGKGYGFVATKTQRYFIHIRDFSRCHKRPAVGDSIRFALGQDAKGRPCATKALHINDGGRISGAALACLGVLLILPVMALLKLRPDWRWVAGLATVVNLLAFYTYAVDKRRAWERLWRLPEARLHFVALIGGWPGAFLAQRNYRHKCSKLGFQMVFWFTVLLYQGAAFDCLNDWKYSQAGLKEIKRLSGRMPWRS